MKVKKRNGSFEEFDINKIINAVKKAFIAVGEDCPTDFKEKFTEIEFKEPLSVEDIQNSVEKWLMQNYYFNVAKAFIIYREQHKQARFYKDRIDYMEEYSRSTDNAASSSETDANANVSIKNVANLEGEVYKFTNRLIQRMRMKSQLQKDFSEVADQYSKDVESHIIYIHDEASTPVPKHYCMAVSMYPLLVNGTSTMDGLQTTSPHNLDSFCGQFINLAFLLSSQCKGAVGFGEFFNFFDWACVQDFGENYHEKFDYYITSVHCYKQQTIKDKIEQAFQNIVYSINQPASNRSYQSPFINFNYFDSYYWHSLFENFVFPDGSKPKWERVSFLQKIFMKWFNKERTKTLLTYPVESMCLLNDGKEYVDKEYRDFAAEMWAEGHSFFVYTSDNADSVASCCFSKDTKVLWKNSYDGIKLTTLEELHNIKWEPYKSNLKIFHNGSWVKGKSIKLPCRDMYKVTTYNNKEYFMTDNHINVTNTGEKPTSELTTNDYLMFNTMSLDAISENDEHLTYEQGLLIGLFIGDGSFGNYVCLDNSVHNFNLSLNKEKWEKVEASLSKLGNFKLGTIYNNVYPITCYNKELTTFISKWTTNEPNNTKALNKSLNLNCLAQSKEFRQGILDGWYITDGGNSNRCYTISKELVERMEILCTSLGKQCVINVSDKTDEAVIIRGQEFNRNYPLYCLRWYTDSNHRINKDINKSWIKKNNSIYWRIKSIEKVEYTDDVYCIQCNNENEPYFTLPSGLITHNCRLRNDVKLFTSTTGLTGIEVGSCNVITLNLNRIVQDHAKLANERYATGKFTNEAESLKDYLITILERVYKYHVAYKNILYDWEKRGMITAANAGYIHMNKLYSTYGINGLNEAAEFLGLEVSNNKEYIEFCSFILGIIRDFIREHNSKKYMLNLEEVPAESLGVKNYNWDKEDGYYIKEGKNLYNSYIYNAHDSDTTILDKLTLQGGEIAKALSGGQACHINLEDHLSKEQYLKLMDFAIKKGCNYFTFNIPNTSCDKCGKIYKQPLHECPNCSSKELTYWTRIIGFLRPTKSFSKERQVEENKRVYHNKNI